MHYIHTTVYICIQQIPKISICTVYEKMYSTLYVLFFLQGLPKIIKIISKWSQLYLTYHDFKMNLLFKRYFSIGTRNSTANSLQKFHSLQRLTIIKKQD